MKDIIIAAVSFVAGAIAYRLYFAKAVADFKADLSAVKADVEALKVKIALAAVKVV